MGGYLPIDGDSSGRVCTWSLRSRLVVPAFNVSIEVTLLSYLWKTFKKLWHQADPSWGCGENIWITFLFRFAIHSLLSYLCFPNRALLLQTNSSPDGDLSFKYYWIKTTNHRKSNVRKTNAKTISIFSFHLFFLFLISPVSLYYKIPDCFFTYLYPCFTFFSLNFYRFSHRFYRFWPFLTFLDHFEPFWLFWPFWPFLTVSFFFYVLTVFDRVFFKGRGYWHQG